jgi:phosphocarrier protein HPr
MVCSCHYSQIHGLMEKAIFVRSTGGLHASLAAKLVQLAQQYNVDFELHYKDKVVDLKSILGLMSLCVPEGENITIVAIGKSSELALESLSELFQ